MSNKLVQHKQWQRQSEDDVAMAIEQTLMYQVEWNDMNRIQCMKW